MNVPGPALGFLELESIARGMVVADALVKKAPVTLALCEATTPGKYLVLFSGGVGEVEEAFKEGLAVAGATLLDKLMLPQASAGLVRALSSHFRREWGESVGIVETHTVAAALQAADTALKHAEVWMKHLHLARNIGGKGTFTLTGELNMVEAALEGVTLAVEPQLLLATELIRRPHTELHGTVL
jgi:microcompartment protein CcmL/EutN